MSVKCLGDGAYCEICPLFMAACFMLISGDSLLPINFFLLRIQINLVWMISGAIKVSAPCLQSKPHSGGEGAPINGKPSLQGAGRGRAAGPPEGSSVPRSPSPTLALSWCSIHTEKKLVEQSKQTPTSSKVTRVSSKPQNLVKMVSKCVLFWIIIPPLKS